MIEILNDFERHLIEDGKRPKTVESYVGDIKGLLTYLDEGKVVFDGVLNRYYITSYKNKLMEKDYEPTTINKKINSISSFNTYLVDNGYMNEVVINLKRDRVRIANGSEKAVEIYDDKLVNNLCLYVTNREKVSCRDKMIILLLLFTGVRVSELCSIKIKHIDFLTGHLKVTGKGGKIREIPLKDEVIEAIKGYIRERCKSKYKGSEYLILGQRGAIQRDAVNTLLEKHTRLGGFDKKLKPHTFRHTFCTRLVKKGVPITTVSKLAGHSNVETTAKFYINSSREDKIRAVNLL